MSRSKSYETEAAGVSFQVFYRAGRGGWYWRAIFSGPATPGSTVGPFETRQEARDHADDMLSPRMGELNGAIKGSTRA